MATWVYHVEPNDDGQWRVRRGDLESPVALYTNIDAAISAARVLARINVGGVFVHGADGIKKTDHRGQKISPAVNTRIRMRA
jgi:hypothetical protein